MAINNIPLEKGITIEYLCNDRKDEQYHSIADPILLEIVRSGRSRFKTESDIVRLFQEVPERSAWEILAEEQRRLPVVNTRYIL